MIELTKRQYRSKRRLKPRPGYVISLTKDPVSYWNINSLSTPNIALAKIFYTREKIEAALRCLLRRFPEAEIVEVSVTTDDEGAEIVNGYPHRDVIRTTKLHYNVWDKYGGRCAYCGRFITRSECRIDWFYPGRGEEDDNLMPACKECADKKKGLTPGQFQTLIESQCRGALRKLPEYRTALQFNLVTEFPRITFYYARPEARIQLELSAKRSQEREENKDFVYGRGEYVDQAARQRAYNEKRKKESEGGDDQ